MIASADVMPLLLAVCPSYEKPWKEHFDFFYQQGDPQLLYVDLGNFAHHLVRQCVTGDTAEFPAVFEVIERLHIEGDPLVTEAATIGLLEGLQNHAGHQAIDAEVFQEWLHPESLRWWRGLQNFWSGRATRVLPSD